MDIDRMIEIVLKNNVTVIDYGKAFKVANNAIYFNDRSDYLSALYEICAILKPELNSEDGENYGKEYLE